MKGHGLATVALAAVLALGGCSTRQEGDNQASAAPAPAATADNGVTREVVAAPTPSPVAAPAPAAIQTQPGPKGSQVSLNRVAVTGDILTVSLTYQGVSCCAYITVDQVSAIDDATSQRLGVLKDNAGNWMAAPFDSGTPPKQLRVGWDGSTTQVWFKFPAPPATSKTVSIAIPEVGPFDAVPITR